MVSLSHRSVLIWGRILLCACLLMGASARADITLHLGPSSMGNGGQNPVSIPPLNIADYGLVWLMESQREWVVSIFPGVFYGYRYRFPKTGLYASGGGGVGIDLNGLGPAVYSAVGWNSCGSRLCFNAEYKQAVGVATAGVMINPYAFRIGVTLLQ
jgi:hypothetical protein